MAPVISQSRPGASGSRQGSVVEVPEPDRGAWGAAGIDRPAVSGEGVQLARSHAWAPIVPLAPASKRVRRRGELEAACHVRRLWRMGWIIAAAVLGGAAAAGYAKLCDVLM